MSTTEPFIPGPPDGFVFMAHPDTGSGPVLVPAVAQALHEAHGWSVVDAPTPETPPAQPEEQPPS